MSRRLRPLLLSLHLYAGLFVSPFVLVFALSVLFLVHAWIPGRQRAVENRSVTSVLLPAQLESLSGRDQLAALHGVLAQLKVDGEISAVRQFPRERRFVVSA